MEQYKQEFIEFMVESEVLKFGDFTLKSGRKSPFFMNAGAYDDEMKSVVVSVTTVSPRGEVRTYSVKELDFGYRHSNL